MQGIIRTCWIKKEAPKKRKMHAMQVRIWRHMLETYKSHNIIQKPTNQQSLEKDLYCKL